MIIKVLYIIGIVLVIRLVVNSLKKYDELQQTVKNQNIKNKQGQTKDSDDIIDAEYTVLNDKKD